MMTTQTFDPTGLYKQALDTFETAMKTGLQVQEETTKLFSDKLQELGSPEQWQQKTQAMVQDMIPMAQKNIDEAVAAMNQNAQTCMDLMKKGMETCQAGSLTDVQDKNRELWEDMLAAMRKNAQTMIQANTRILESLTALSKKNVAAQE